MWVNRRARWYAPNLGRFISEDSLLGDVIDPPSRHLYAYGQGEPVGTWDPDGRYWKFTGATSFTLQSAARILLGKPGRWPMLVNANRDTLSAIASPGTKIPRNSWVYVPIQWLYKAMERSKYNRKDDVRPPWVHPKLPGSYRPITEQWRTRMYQGQRTARLGDYEAAFSFMREQLYSLIDSSSGFRARNPSKAQLRTYRERTIPYSRSAVWATGDLAGGSPQPYLGDVKVVPGAAPGFCFGNPCTIGQVIFLGGNPRDPAVMAHEYIHVLQWEGRGGNFAADYLRDLALGRTTEAGHAEEAPAYIYEGYLRTLGTRYVSYPWVVWKH